MSFFSTIGISQKSFELVLDHPDLFLQPAGIRGKHFLKVITPKLTFLVTFFSYSKLAVFYGQRDIRIKFSPIWTFVNFLVSSSQVLVIKFLLANHLEKDKDGDIHNNPIYDDLKPDGSLGKVRLFHQRIEYVFTAVVCLHVLSALLTTILIFYDSLMCWCSPCCLGEGEATVFDPEHPELNLTWRNGNVVDLDQEDGAKLDDNDDENGVSMEIKIA